MTKNLDLRRRFLAMVLTVALVATSVFAIAPTNAFAEGETVDDGVADVITLKFTDSGTATIYNEWTTPIIVNGGDKDNVAVSRYSVIYVAVSNNSIVTITESENDTFRKWDFTDEPLVKNVNCAITEIPEMSKFTSDIAGTIAGAWFFGDFNSSGALTSLPEGSFDTSSITNVGSSFFSGFNAGGLLTSLPEGSFDTSKITTVGGGFFSAFNRDGLLTSLPAGSFDTSNITTVGSLFFAYFNFYGALTSLPAGSFDTSSIVTVDYNFFYEFNNHGSLTSLPDGSFDTSGITTASGYFFASFNLAGSLTSLPEGSFDISSITTTGDCFFYGFNCNYSSLTSLPDGSFDTSSIITIGDYFFSYFNYNGSLTSLPAGSFDISSITTTGDNFFYGFNNNGSLTSLPLGSFDTSKITTVGGAFFSGFNSNGSLTSLPLGSFDTSKITTVGDTFFSGVNVNSGSLTSLPEGSFDISSITTAGGLFFWGFNRGGALTSLPAGSFDTSSITIAGGDFFRYFNYYGSLVQGNKGVVITNNSNQDISEFSFGTDLPDSIPTDGGKAYINTDPLLQYTVTFDANGGSATSSKTVKAGYSIGTLPTTTLAGYTFAGWWTAKSDGIKISSSTKILNDITFYAHWKENEKSLSEANIAKIEDQTYDTKAKKPALTVKDGSKTLVSGTDYTVSYNNNINAGTATVTITGKGNYTGTKSVTFKIVPANASVFSVATIKDQVNNGKAKSPILAVKHGSTTLKLNTHYMVKHSNNKSVGTATITITGKGNYTGTKTVSFKIVPKATSVSKVTPTKKQLKITWGKVSGTTKYEVRYRVKGASKWKAKTVAGTSKAYTAKNLKKGKAYQVQVRSYKTVSGVKYYSAWSKTKVSGKVK
ncbi:MAG: InlB B-repeat-containing protein [Clostridiales Family XIII bacterium]|jgi:uncharacterized repeat protein (TIGR02543 family)|nr:InlB B-repeat-containing protein [Clostridiales Family XIII bacterium]